MSNVIFSDEYDVLPQLLREARQRAGLSQRRLAQRMKRSASHIHKIETRQRRIEVIEFCRFIEALEGDPRLAFDELRRRLALLPAPDGTPSNVRP